MENIKRIVAIIVEKVIEAGPGADEETIRQDLVKYGFNSQDIDAAMCWMSVPAPREIVTDSRALRVLMPHERAFFTDDAVNEIMSLYYEGMLNVDFLEELLMMSQCSDRGVLSKEDLYDLISEMNCRDDECGDSRGSFVTIH